MIKCSKCNGTPNEHDIIGWKCNSCGKIFQVTKNQLHSLWMKKQTASKEFSFKCPACNNNMDNGNEKIAWKCSCGNVNVGKLMDYGEDDTVIHNSNLIQCPECGKEVSAKAKNCVHCGYPIKPKKKLAIKRIGIAAAFIAVVIICITVILISNRLNETEQADVERASAAIAEIGEVDLSSSGKIIDAENIFQDLSEKCKRHVKNRKELTNARDTYDHLKADKTMELIEQIETVSLENQDAVDNAQKSYDELSDEQKELVDNTEDLLSAVNQLSNLRIDDVESKISAIGTITLDSEEDIKAAREAYNKLSDEDKSKISSYDDLTNAEAAYEELAVNSCIDLIDSIGTVALDSKDKINEAENIYNSLSKDVKNKVTNYSTLTSAKDTLKQLEKEEDYRQRTLNPGDSFSTSKWEVTYKKTDITAKLLPNNTSGYYMYYYADDNETFVDIVFEIKNIDTDILGIEDMVGNCNVEYDGATLTKRYNLYTSSGSQIDAVYSWDGLDALDSITLHVAIGMPRELQTNNKSITVRLNIAGKEKIFYVR